MSEAFAAAAPRLFAVAAQALGWKPDDFWRATPAELAAALAPPDAAAAPIGRADLLRLMEHDDAGIWER